MVSHEKLLVTNERSLAKSPKMAQRPLEVACVAFQQFEEVTPRLSFLKLLLNRTEPFGTKQRDSPPIVAPLLRLKPFCWGGLGLHNLGAEAPPGLSGGIGHHLARGGARPRLFRVGTLRTCPVSFPMLGQVAQRLSGHYLFMPGVRIKDAELLPR